MIQPEGLERGKPSEDVQRYICTDAVTTVECDNRKKNNKNKKNIWRPAAGGNPTAAASGPVLGRGVMLIPNEGTLRRRSKRSRERGVR